MNKNNYDRENNYDPTIAHLAKHMQELREMVPVNYELKAELKKKLLEQLRKNKEAQTPSLRRKKRLSKWPFSLLLLVLLGFFTYLYFTNDMIKVISTTPLGSYSLAEISSDQPVSISPNGDLVLMEAGGSIAILKEKGTNSRLIEGNVEGSFLRPVWSNQGEWIAVIFETEDRSELWLLKENKQSGRRFIYAEEGIQFSSITWSIDDQWLMIHKKDKYTDEEAWLHVRADGTQVYTAEAPEKNMAIGQQELFTNIQLPRDLKKQVERADKYWYDWNGKQQALVLAINQGKEVQVYVLKLKNNGNIAKN